MHPLCPPRLIPRPRRRRRAIQLALLLVVGPLLHSTATTATTAAELRVGTGTAEFEADDSMVIAGGIGPGKATGQEGKLRAVAFVLDHADTRVAIIACDVLMMDRLVLDPVVAELQRVTGIPAAHILINCTHTHHAPSTLRVHDYEPDPTFTRRVQEGIVRAVRTALTNRVEARCLFHMGTEHTVGQNSRLLLDDGMIYWIGPRTNVVRATGPFDPELPVLSFRDTQDRLLGLLFNHSTHTIGTRLPGKRSPSIYGLAAQDIETELGGVVSFLEGASGSTHNLELTGEQATARIQNAVLDALSKSTLLPITQLQATKRPLRFRIRQFDESAEDQAVTRYCRKYAPGHSEAIIKVFRAMRKNLAPLAGQERETWVQTIRIGDVALVGVPAEYFTQLGLDIKNRSPFRHTLIAELANDWIGYLPNLEGHKLGGYQVWTGYHSYAEPGTGERIADLAVAMLHDLAR